MTAHTWREAASVLSIFCTAGLACWCAVIVRRHHKERNIVAAYVWTVATAIFCLLILVATVVAFAVSGLD